MLETASNQSEYARCEERQPQPPRRLRRNAVNGAACDPTRDVSRKTEPEALESERRPRPREECPIECRLRSKHGKLGRVERKVRSTTLPRQRRVVSRFTP